MRHAGKYQVKVRNQINVEINSDPGDQVRRKRICQKSGHVCFQNRLGTEKNFYVI